MTTQDLIRQNPNATDAEIVVLANGTYRDIALDALEPHLLKTGLKRRMERDAKDTALPEELRDGIRDLLDLFASPRLRHLSMSDPVIRQRVTGGLDALVALGRWTRAEADGLLALGRVFGVVKESDVAAERVAMVREDAVRAASSALDDARQAGAIVVDQTEPVDRDAVRAAVLASLDAWVAGA